MAISLDALLKELDGIEAFQKDRWYRFHGKEGLADFERTGKVRANPAGKYSDTYFSEGAPESRYRRKGGGSFVEAHPSTVQRIPSYSEKARYGTTPELVRGRDRFRLSEIYDDLDTGTQRYRTVYDNLSPHKYYGRQLLQGVVNPLSIGAEALLYSGDVGAGSDQVGPEDPAMTYLKNRRK